MIHCLLILSPVMRYLQSAKRKRNTSMLYPSPNQIVFFLNIIITLHFDSNHSQFKSRALLCILRKEKWLLTEKCQYYHTPIPRTAEQGSLEWKESDEES